MESVSSAQSKRLYSLDALRGFDMFWIMGGEAVFAGLATLTGWPVFEWWAGQLEHVEWHGFRFYDMIFPLFLFIAGISFPYSLSKRREKGEAESRIYKHVFTRGILLVILGIIYNNGIRFDFDTLRYGSVLGRIGLAWMFAAIIYMNAGKYYRFIWFGSILTGYWLLLLLFPAHDLGANDPFSREGNLASYIDRLLMPGKLYLGNHDPEGLFSTIPAIATALLGMFTGDYMRSGHSADKPLKKVLFLILGGLFFIALGRIWNIVFPINKNIWSSSFVCYVGGLSILLFAFFYLIIDVWQYRRWAFFFVVIGLNPITIYLTRKIIGFGNANNFLFKGVAELLPETWAQLINGIGITAIGWIFLYILYKKKIFLKI